MASETQSQAGSGERPRRNGVAGLRLSRREFAALLQAYRPSKEESFDDTDPRFIRPMHHALKCRERLYIALRAGLARLPEGRATVVDFGPFPGSLLRLLRRLRPDAAFRLVGAGMMVDPGFIRFMHDDSQATIVPVNLDPQNRQFLEKSYPHVLPVEPGSVDLVFALEILEHLSSPHHLLAEAHRILAPGGCLVITTPNVTRIGNVFKLLLGRSPNDRLAPPGYFNPDDEWQPHVREYAMTELTTMLASAGFVIEEARFFLGEDTQDCRRPLRQHALDCLKMPFYLVPHFRGSLLVVGHKAP